MNSEPQHDVSARMLVFSRWVSILFHPVFVTLFLFIAAIFFVPADDEPGGLSPWLVLFLALIFVVVLPVMQSAWLIREKKISSWDMPSPAERRWPLLTTVILTVVLQLFFRMLGVTGLAGYLPLLGLGIGGVVYLVNLFWKISLHLVAMGTLTAFALSVFPAASPLRMAVLVVICVAITLVTGCARFKLKAHNPAQLVVGWMAGFAISLIFFAIFY